MLYLAFSPKYILPWNLWLKLLNFEIHILNEIYEVNEYKTIIKKTSVFPPVAVSHLAIIVFVLSRAARPSGKSDEGEDNDHFILENIHPWKIFTPEKYSPLKNSHHWKIFTPGRLNDWAHKHWMLGWYILVIFCSTPPLPPVIICHHSSSFGLPPPSPSGDDVICEQPLTRKSSLGSFLLCFDDDRRMQN